MPKAQSPVCTTGTTNLPTYTTTDCDSSSSIVNKISTFRQHALHQGFVPLNESLPQTIIREKRYIETGSLAVKNTQPVNCTPATRKQCKSKKRMKPPKSEAKKIKMEIVQNLEQVRKIKEGLEYQRQEGTSPTSVVSKELPLPRSARTVYPSGTIVTSKQTAVLQPTNSKKDKGSPLSYSHLMHAKKSCVNINGDTEKLVTNTLKGSNINYTQRYAGSCCVIQMHNIQPQRCKEASPFAIRAKYPDKLVDKPFKTGFRRQSTPNAVPKDRVPDFMVPILSVCESDSEMKYSYEESMWDISESLAHKLLPQQPVEQKNIKTTSPSMKPSSAVQTDPHKGQFASTELELSPVTELKKHESPGSHPNNANQCKRDSTLQASKVLHLSTMDSMQTSAGRITTAGTTASDVLFDSTNRIATGGNTASASASAESINKPIFEKLRLTTKKISNNLKHTRAWGERKDKKQLKRDLREEARKAKKSL